MKPILVTSGEPAGVGPDICLKLADTGLPVVVAGDIYMLKERADTLGIDVRLIDYKKHTEFSKGSLTVLHYSCNRKVIPGVLDVENAKYVLRMLEDGAGKCLYGTFGALVTAPVHKGVINDAGIRFSGHTEFLREVSEAREVVMMLANKKMRVALLTTHLPLTDVASNISQKSIKDLVSCLHKNLKTYFGIKNPKILLAGLNPHAGEGGHLGMEEINIFSPAIASIRAEGIDIEGPFPADTMFSPENCARADVFVAAYHDQGLPVLKYSGFGDSVNITLGLPIIRTSVDHGTALSIAGTNGVSESSLLVAIDTALNMYKNREEL